MEEREKRATSEEEKNPEKKRITIKKTICTAITHYQLLFSKWVQTLLYTGSTSMVPIGIKMKAPAVELEVRQLSIKMPSKIDAPLVTKSSNDDKHYPL